MEGLTIVILYAALGGLIGAGIRGVLGIKKALNEATDKSPFKFNWALFGTDAVIGIGAGAITGLLTGLMGWNAAIALGITTGYAGSDALDGLLKK